ncbi:MAG: amino acid ABC transporter substrate-binding protein [Desulfobacteraceae bacterium]|nr:amino acid ABC transporter substrate-binding protein [Desulfobacteraceae bacterium]
MIFFKTMLRNSVFLIFLFFFPSILWASEQRIICTGHPDYPPFMWKVEKTIVGAGAQLIRMALDEMEQDYVIQSTGPWARAQEMVQKGKADFLVGAYSNVRRRLYMDYSHAYATDPNSIFVLTENTKPLADRHDLVGKIGISMFGDSFGDGLDSFIETKLNVLRVYDSKSLFKQLISKKVDYILWGDYPCRINAAVNNYDDQIKKIEKPLAYENMYITVSKKSPHKGLISSMNKLIDRLRNDGTIDRLLKRYLYLYINSKKTLKSFGESAKPVVQIVEDPKGNTENEINMALVKEIFKRCGIAEQVKIVDIGKALESIKTPGHILFNIRKKDIQGKDMVEWFYLRDPDIGFAFRKDMDRVFMAKWHLAVESIINDKTFKL